MSLLTLPGLIDPHVHLRDPGQTDKEDFLTGTQAALAGGYTTILDMPNNVVPITTTELLDEKIALAKEKIVCDVGFHFGSLGDNLDAFAPVKDTAIGLKLFLNQTTGNFVIDTTLLEKILASWPGDKPVLVHAEEEKLEEVITVVRKLRRHVHVCHVSLARELQMIIEAKNEGIPITCGVTPHHLILTADDVTSLKGFGMMKPILKTKKDIEFLWTNLAAIDVIESDHAPHTKEEKEGEHPPFGVPGLETTLPLLLTAVSENRLTIADIIRLCHTNPAEIFGITTDSQTYTIIDPDSSFIIRNSSLFTKCGWSPFHGRNVRGRVVEVALRGETVYKDGQILAKPGSGKIVTPSRLLV